MKKLSTIKVLGMASVVVACFSMIFSACTKKETEFNKAAPTLTMKPGTTSNIAGALVSTTVTVDAPEGGKTLSFLVNGATNANLPNVDLGGLTTKDVAVNFTIPANATVGASYLISIQATDNKNQNSQAGSFLVTVSATPPKTIVEVTTNITSDVTWTSDKIYRLNGFIRVGEDIKQGGATTPTITAAKKATLTIQAGTVIYGMKGTPGGALIIQRGSKIIANGTSTNPIIFTSDQTPGIRTAGDWAGVVICGQSANNISGSTGTPGIAELEGSYGAYHGGGASPILDDNSGTLNYVRIEFAGYPINPNQELNGLTFGSVGSGTTIQNVQVTYANDDSFEWFGGTVNCKNIIAYKGIDDDFDTDNGFSGNVQFGLGIRDPLIADQSESNGFEADNDGNGTANTPFTSPIFSNMTLIGPKATSGTTINALFGAAAHLRRNLKQKVFNSFITGYPTGIYIDGTQGAPSGTDDAVIHAQNGDVVVATNVLAGVENWGANGFGSAASTDEQTALGLVAAGSNHPNAPRGRIVSAGNIPSGTNPWINGVFTVNERQISSMNALPWYLQSNDVVAKWSDATIGIDSKIFDPKSITPTFVPTGSKLTSGALFTDGNFTGKTFFNQTISYRGAFGTLGDWTAGWVNWNPQLTDYSHQ